MKRGNRGRGAKAVAIVVAAALVMGVVGAPVYVLPATDDPAPVDAVYVIGPPTDERMELAQDLIDQGLSDTLLVSIPDADGVYTAMLDTYERANTACDGGIEGAEVLCFEPDPFTTRGEARYLRDLAAERGWSRVSVITFTPHITRTRVIMERCFDGDLTYLDPGGFIPPWVWVYQYGYQTAGFVKVALADGC